MAWSKPISIIANFFGAMRQGVAASIIQSYDEVNKKRGLQWENSRLVTAVSSGDKFYSVLHVGSKDVDLKARVLGATGGGVIGRAYRIQAGDVTLSSPLMWYNYNSAVSGQPETSLHDEPGIVFNTPVANLAIESNKIHADIFAITNVQNQAKGVILQAFGGNHILAPDEYILMELESYDSSQDITVKLDIYEGGLDFYP